MHGKIVFPPLGPYRTPGLDGRTTTTCLTYVYPIFCFYYAGMRCSVQRWQVTFMTRVPSRRGFTWGPVDVNVQSHGDSLACDRQLNPPTNSGCMHSYLLAHRH